MCAQDTARGYVLTDEAYRDLEEAVGPENVSREPGVLDGYAWQPTINDDPAKWVKRPVAVVLPASTEEVQAVVRACNRHSLRFKAFSTGWGVWCGPTYDNVVQVDLRRMNRILEIDEKNMYAVVEPYAIAAQIAYPHRQCVAFVGDGGFSMLMAEFATAVKYRLPVVFVVMNDDRYGAIKWLQERMFGRWGEAEGGKRAREEQRPQPYGECAKHEAQAAAPPEPPLERREQRDEFGRLGAVAACLHASSLPFVRCAVTRPTPARPPAPATRLHRRRIVTDPNGGSPMPAPPPRSIVARRSRIGAALLFALLLLATGTARPQDAERPELVPQIGHTGLIFGLEFSPDGKTLASCSFDRTIRLWEAETGDLVRVISGHLGPVTAVTFSRDGSTLVSAAWDGVLRLWDARTGSLRRVLIVPEAPVSALGARVAAIAISPDGTQLATASDDNTIRLWNLATGEVTHTIPELAARVRSLAYSPGGSLLVAAGMSPQVDCWNPATGQRVRTLTGHRGWVRAVAFSPAGDRIATGSDDDTVRLWNPQTGETIAEMPGHRSRVRSLSFSRDGTLLASGSWDGTARLWDGRTGRPLRTLAGHTGFVRAVAVAPAGDLVATGCEDASIRLWDPATGRTVRVLAGHTGWPKALVVDPRGRWVATAGEERVVRLWESATGRLLRTLAGHTAAVTSLAVSGDGRLLVSGGADRSARLWDPRTGSMLAELPAGGEGPVVAVACSPDGQIVASAGRGGAIQLWDVPTGAQMRALTGHQDAVNALVFAPDGRSLASGSRDRTVRMWDPRTGQPVQTWRLGDAAVTALAFSPDGRRLACGTWDYRTVVLDVASGSEAREIVTPFTLRPVYAAGVTALAFSADGRLLAVAGDDGTIRLWGEEGLRRTLPVQAGSVAAVAFGSGSLYTIAQDEAVRRWDPATGRLVATMRVLPTGDREAPSQEWIAFTPDGYYTGSDGAERAIRWRVGGRLVPAEVFRRSYRKPALVRQALAGTSEPPAAP